ncbi:uncharacterized protein LOC131633826 [Vicia villosa]|uniref:uncharacterized protein LOC131633826 n=1 Tax=Vicia villosa TaxID=3911 RepID=UPI00273C035D|nr:uncharacterized protein LOC131633826 [Vicia villosa]
MSIHKLCKDYGIVSTSHEDITREIMQFYENLMGTAQKSMEYVDIKSLRKVVITVSYQLNINGRVIKSMQANEGLRQGDSISLFLFVVVMKYLHRKLEDLQCIPNFNFYSKCENLGINDVSFGDDVLLFFFVQLKLDKVGVFLKW